MDIFEAKTDQFGGVTISDNFPAHSNIFDLKLKNSLEEWKKNGIKVVWIYIPKTRGNLIPIALEQGFDFHHCRENILVLVQRLIQNAIIPSFASHYIGAGGVVTNSANELLVVSEKYRRTKKAFFKLPGGTIQPKEKISTGVMREILEETGIQTAFESMVCFRHRQEYRFDMADIYFVCKLKAITNTISKQESEIDECRWIPIKKYLDSPETSSFNRAIVQSAIYTEGWKLTDIEDYDNEKYEVFAPTITHNEDK